LGLATLATRKRNAYGVNLRLSGTAATDGGLDTGVTVHRLVRRAHHGDDEMGLARSASGARAEAYGSVRDVPGKAT
jgi:hypothetical protein